jgi:septal ring factor EnvC (AmiA/AmiB activator)
MAKEKQVYIQNTRDHGIKVHSADGKLVKRLEIAKFDNLTGRVTHTGHTPLTEAEFATLFNESKLFSSFLAQGFLVKHDELPEDAMTPHDALVRAKREAAESDRLLRETEEANATLRAELSAAETELTATSARLDAAEVNSKTLAGELVAADVRNKELTDKLAAADARAKELTDKLAAAEKGKKA